MDTLSICALFKNETPYLKEWIEYHKLVGVTHFYLYDNENEEQDFLKVLAPYIANHEVTLIPWKCAEIPETWEEQRYIWIYRTQVPAYEHAIALSHEKTQWLACIDIDEFIVPSTQNSLIDQLNAYSEDIPAVEILWEIFGTSNIHKIPENMLMIELMHKTSNLPLKRFQRKTILKPKLYNGFFEPPHNCLYIDGKKPYEAKKEELVINHYINKCNDYLLNVKIPNKMKMEALSSLEEVQQLLISGNDQEDQKKYIHKFIPALRKNMGFS